jgi:hypothetical protein
MRKFKMKENKSSEKPSEDTKKISFILKSVKDVFKKLDPEIKTSKNENISENDNNNSKKASSEKKSELPSDSEKPSSNISAKLNQVKTIIKEDRQKIILIIGLLLAAIFIITGISLLFGTSDKVSDNVIFGERSVTSAFLIIIGLLIIAGIYAPKIIGKTSFDNIYQEMKGVEKDSSKKKEDIPSDNDHEIEKNE